MYNKDRVNAALVFAISHIAYLRRDGEVEGRGYQALCKALDAMKIVTRTLTTISYIEDDDDDDEDKEPSLLVLYGGREGKRV